MQNSSNTAPKTRTIDAAVMPHDAEGLSRPIELDNESLRHVGGGIGETPPTPTPVVSW